jgi:hypothetical protein
MTGTVHVMLVRVAWFTPTTGSRTLLYDFLLVDTMTGIASMSIELSELLHNSLVFMVVLPRRPRNLRLIVHVVHLSQERCARILFEGPRFESRSGLRNVKSPHGQISKPMGSRDLKLCVHKLRPFPI